MIHTTNLVGVRCGVKYSGLETGGWGLGTGDSGPTAVLCDAPPAD